MKTIICITKNKWDFADSRTISSQSLLGELRIISSAATENGRWWETPNHDPEVIHKEAYGWAPQWLYIHDMSPGMYVKQSVNAIISVLGSPLHAELVDIQSRADTETSNVFKSLYTSEGFSYPQSLQFIMDSNSGEIKGSLKVSYTSRLPHCRGCTKFGHWTTWFPQLPMIPAIGNSVPQPVVSLESQSSRWEVVVVGQSTSLVISEDIAQESLQISGSDRVANLWILSDRGHFKTDQKERNHTLQIGQSTDAIRQPISCNNKWSSLTDQDHDKETIEEEEGSTSTAINGTSKRKFIYKELGGCWQWLWPNINWGNEFYS